MVRAADFHGREVLSVKAIYRQQCGSNSKKMRRKPSGALLNNREQMARQYPMEVLLGETSFDVISKVSMNPFVPLNSKAFAPSR